MMSMASSKLIMPPLLTRQDAPRLRRLELPRLSNRRILDAGRVESKHGLVHWSKRGNGGPRRGAPKGAGQIAGARGNRRPRKPGRADPDRRDPDGGELSRRPPPGDLP